MNLGFFKEFMPYGLLSVIVLVIFYGIYYTKMIIQKRQGIKTKQIGSRKEKKLHTVETLMAIATYLIVVVEVLSIVFNYNLMPSNGRINGIFIGLCGDCVFLFAIICMKDSWRAGIPEKDQTKLVTNGIYKVSRNPAFLGFDLVYIGILVTYFNPVNLICTLFAIIMLHLQMLQEEKYMEDLCKIRDVYRAIAEFETQFMQQYNLSLNEGMLLCTLLNTPRLTSGEIAEALGLTCSNTSKLIRSVEEKKLIARIIGKVDKRQMHFSLTAEGKEQITAIKSTTHEMPELLQQIVGLLEK